MRCHSILWGGNGTIYQAMSYRVPIIGMPTMIDQEFNLDRVEELGIEIHLGELRFQSQHLVKSVDNTLLRMEYITNAGKYQTILDA